MHDYFITILNYPDGSHPVVWLPDANVGNFSGKHILLFTVASYCYPIIWHCLHYASVFLTVVSSPSGHENILLGQKSATVYTPGTFPCSLHNQTLLLLCLRIVLYVTSSVTTSRDPRINLIVTGITALALSMLSTNKIYRRQHVKQLHLSQEA